MQCLVFSGTGIVQPPRGIVISHVVIVMEEPVDDIVLDDGLNDGSIIEFQGETGVIIKHLCHMQ